MSRCNSKTDQNKTDNESKCSTVKGSSNSIITHVSCIAAGVGRAFMQSRLSVCLSVCPHSKSKRKMALATNSPTPNLLHIYSIEVARHALTQRSKGQRSRSDSYKNRHSRMVAIDACCYGRVLLLPAWVSMSIQYDCLCFLVLIAFSQCMLLLISNRR